MHLKPVGLLASAVWILGAAGVSADGRIALTSAELDDVTALAGYGPAEVGLLREPSLDDSPERERRRRALTLEMADHPVRPIAISDRAAPMIADPSPRAVVSAPAAEPTTQPAPLASAATYRPAIALRGTIRLLRPGAAPMAQLTGGRHPSPGQ